MNRKIIALLLKEIFLLTLTFNGYEIKTCKYCEKMSSKGGLYGCICSSQQLEYN